jgi:hypothetical protein
MVEMHERPPFNVAAEGRDDADASHHHAAFEP